MNYEKLTVDRFAARLKEGAYKGLTGARRAIGKTDWSKKDKEGAHALADKHFAGGGKSKAATKAAPKKAASAAPKKASVKAAPKKAAASTKPKAETKAATPTKRAPAATPAGNVVPPGPPILEEVTRQNSASAVISAYRNSGPLNTLEQRAYDIATAEYAENASRAARRVVETATRGIPTPGALQENATEDEDAPVPSREVVMAPNGTAPRIPAVTNGTEPELTEEERKQYERLERGASAVPAILGQGQA